MANRRNAYSLKKTVLMISCASNYCFKKDKLWTYPLSDHLAVPAGQNFKLPDILIYDKYLQN